MVNLLVNGLIFSLLFLSSRISSHTIEVCNVVSPDGSTVELLAGTYHYKSELDNNGGFSGGILLKPQGAAVPWTRYDFTALEADSVANDESPPSCATPGTNCDCSRCPTANTPVTWNGNIKWWQKVTIAGLADGTYDVSTSSDTVIEARWSTSCDWTFTILGSVIVPQACDYYLYFDDGVARTKAEAEQKCVELGSTLASITTSDELECALDAVGDNTAPWVGMRSTDNHGDWEYTDGTACPYGDDWKCLDPSFWINGRPLCIETEDGAYCAHLKPRASGGKLWNDKKCASTLTAILCNNPSYIRPKAKSEPGQVVNNNEYDVVDYKKFNVVNDISLSKIIIGVAVFVMFMVIINAAICYWCLAKNNISNNNKNIDDNQI